MLLSFVLWSSSELDFLDFLPQIKGRIFSVTFHVILGHSIWNSAQNILKINNNKISEKKHVYFFRILQTNWSIVAAQPIHAIWKRGLKLHQHSNFLFSQVIQSKIIKKIAKNHCKKIKYKTLSGKFATKYKTDFQKSVN